MEDRRPLTDRVRCSKCKQLVPIDKQKLVKDFARAVLAVDDRAAGGAAIAAAIDGVFLPAPHVCKEPL